MGIGSALRQAREKMGYTLEEMAEITNINIKYLQSLEQDQFDQLPSEFYVRIFMKNYAKRIGLDHQPLLDAYDSFLENQDESSISTYGNATQPEHGFSLAETKQKATQLEEGQNPVLQTYFQPPLRGANGSRFPSLLSEKEQPQEAPNRSSTFLPSLPKQQRSEEEWKQPTMENRESPVIPSTPQARVGAVNAPPYPPIGTGNMKKHRGSESARNPGPIPQQQFLGLPAPTSTHMNPTPVQESYETSRPVRKFVSPTRESSTVTGAMNPPNRESFETSRPTSRLMSTSRESSTVTTGLMSNRPGFDSYESQPQSRLVPPNRESSTVTTGLMSNRSGLDSYDSRPQSKLVPPNRESSTVTGSMSNRPGFDSYDSRPQSRFMPPNRESSTVSGSMPNFANDKNRKGIQPSEFKPRSQTHGKREEEYEPRGPWIVITITMILTAAGTVYYLFYV